MKLMTQTAPFPTLLADLIDTFKYRPGWRFELVDPLERDPGSAGLTLIVTTKGYNSYHPEDGETYRVNHYFPVPPATYDRRSWRAWLHECLEKVERHELNEFFQDGEDRPYAPSHGPGNDPYITREVGTDVDRRTSFRGELNE